MNDQIIPFVEDIEINTILNENYRNVKYTSTNQQFVYMAIEPKDNIHMEIHEDHDQFIRIEKGTGVAIINDKEYELKDGIGIIIPAGTSHEIINTSSTEKLKLYSIYSPPEHKQGLIQKNNPDSHEKNNKEINIPLFLIRHGESNNNYKEKDFIYDFNYDLKNKQLLQKLKDIDLEDDPSLTKKGINQALMLGVFLKNNLYLKNRKLVIYTSPFLRTLQTTKYILKAFNKNNYKVIVNPFIYETGGVYYIDDNLKLKGPGKCLTSDEIKTKFKFNVKYLDKEGQWYKKNYETQNESIKRAKNITEWIKSDVFKNKHKNDIVLFVIHGDFINLLNKEILDINNSDIKFDMSNTSTSLFMLKNNKINVKFINNIEHLFLENINNKIINKL